MSESSIIAATPVFGSGAAILRKTITSVVVGGTVTPRAAIAFVKRRKPRRINLTRRVKMAYNLTHKEIDVCDWINANIDGYFEQITDIVAKAIEDGK